MLTTSFGSISKIKFNHSIAEVEYLRFEKSGRAHLHKYEEVIFVTNGSGSVLIENFAYKINKGDSLRIPKGKSHYMIPDEGGVLEIILWYEK